MSLRQEIGQILVAGGVTGGTGSLRENNGLMAAVAAGEVGGLYMGYPHFRNPGHAHGIIQAFQDAAPDHLFVAADFEAGPGYNCVDGCAHFPYLMGLGFINEPETTRKVAEVTARQALAMGINWLFSPCLDVNLRADNPIIGIRAFGDTPGKVTCMGRSFVEGCREVGILCTAKHFPGGGNTCADTHIVSACDLGDRETWKEKTLPPFMAAIEAGIPCMMTGHTSAPCLDPSATPATYSTTILRDLLRNELGFKGIVISDSLGMEGASHGSSVGERCVAAFEAGCDMLLTPFSRDILSAFERALCDGRLTQSRIDESLARVASARERISALPEACIRPEDDAFAEDVGCRSAHVQKDHGVLPLSPGHLACLTQWRPDEAQYFPREAGVLARLQHGVQCLDPAAPLIALTRACPEAEHSHVLKSIGNKSTVIFNAIVRNYAGDPDHGRLSQGTVTLLQHLAVQGKAVILVILGSPYACLDVPEANAVVCASGDSFGCAEGVLALLRGTRA